MGLLVGVLNETFERFGEKILHDFPMRKCVQNYFRIFGGNIIALDDLTIDFNLHQKLNYQLYMHVLLSLERNFRYRIYLIKKL